MAFDLKKLAEITVLDYSELYLNGSGDTLYPTPQLVACLGEEDTDLEYSDNLQDFVEFLADKLNESKSSHIISYYYEGPRGVIEEYKSVSGKSGRPEIQRRIYVDPHHVPSSPRVLVTEHCYGDVVPSDFLKNIGGILEDIAKELPKAAEESQIAV